MWYLTKHLNYNEKEVIISGYPFLERTGFNPFQSNNSKKTVLYISSALRIGGIIPISKKQEIIFYNNLLKQVTLANCRLIIKIHPLESLDFFQHEVFPNQNKNLKIYKDKNLSDLTIASDVIISDYSTALFYGIKYYKPILILSSKYLDKYPFDFTRYGIGKKVKLEEITNLLENIDLNTLIKKDKYETFIKEYISHNDLSPYQIFFNKITEQ